MKTLSTRIFIAASLGVVLALWVLRPECTGASARPMHPEVRAVTSLSPVVI
jgi:hypothetical protein